MIFWHFHEENWDAEHLSIVIFLTEQPEPQCKRHYALSCDIKNYFQATITWQCAQGNFMIISSQSAIQIMEELEVQCSVRQLRACLLLLQWKMVAEKTSLSWKNTIK